MKRSTAEQHHRDDDSDSLPEQQQPLNTLLLSPLTHRLLAGTSAVHYGAANGAYCQPCLS